MDIQTASQRSSRAQRPGMPLAWSWLRSLFERPGDKDKNLFGLERRRCYYGVRLGLRTATAMAKKTTGKTSKTASTRRKTADRVSDREDGRLPTLLYLNPELLAEVQAAAKAAYQPTWLFVEGVLDRTMKSRRAK
jgi:hypothetical protein